MMKARLSGSESELSDMIERAGMKFMCSGSSKY